jgi:RNA polymerase sigma-70 factor (ECF subfamily)
MSNFEELGPANYDGLATRSSLLRRLRNHGDEVSWQTFFDAYWRLIYNVARKNGLAEADAEDMVQETVIAVARKMPEFRYDPAKGSFKHWLLLITRRRILDHVRKVYRSIPQATGSPQELDQAIAEVPAPSLAPDAEFAAAWELEWRDNFFQAALERVRQRTNPKHSQVFDLCVLQNLPASQVAKMLDLTAAQVYLAKHRMLLTIKRVAKEVEAEAGRASGAR